MPTSSTHWAAALTSFSLWPRTSGETYSISNPAPFGGGLDRAGHHEPVGGQADHGIQVFALDAAQGRPEDELALRIELDDLDFAHSWVAGRLDPGDVVGGGDVVSQELDDVERNARVFSQRHGLDRGLGAAEQVGAGVVPPLRALFDGEDHPVVGQEQRGPGNLLGGFQSGLHEALERVGISSGHHAG